MMKKLCSMILMVCVLLSLMPQTTSASCVKLSHHTKTSGFGNSIKIKKVTYDGVVSDQSAGNKRGTQYKIEVDFKTKVAWKKAARVSSVRDNKGKSYRGYLVDKDKDDCDILISNLQEGRTYTIVLNGIKKRNTKKYRKLSLKVTVPKQKSDKRKIKVTKVEVSQEEDSFGEVDVEFDSKVVWRNNAKVISVYDDAGNSYEGYLTDTDKRECEIFIEHMAYDRTYTIKISGVKAKGASSYETITIHAKAPSKPQVVPEENPSPDSSLAVKKTEYEEEYEHGRMEYTVKFDFNQDVLSSGDSYIKVKDSDGLVYSDETSYVKWDDDECKLQLSQGLSAGTYSYEIVNVKAIGEKTYVTLTGSFVVNGSQIPVQNSSLTVQKAEYEEEYEHGRKEYTVKFDFNQDVLSSGDSYIKVKDSDGLVYSDETSYVKWDDDECELQLSQGLSAGTYSYEIVNVKAIGEKTYVTLTGSFVVNGNQIPVQSSSLTVRKAEYEEEYEHGRMEYTVSFDFNQNVLCSDDSYIKVKDSDGLVYSDETSYVKWDDDECELQLSQGLPAGTYSYEIVNVKATGEKTYVSLTGSFVVNSSQIPVQNNSLTVRKAEYEEEYEHGRMEYTVSFDFNQKIRTDSSYIVIKDEDGNIYSNESSFVEWDSDECEVYLSQKLNIGSNYDYEIVNISAMGEEQFITLTGSFTAT